jgi:hypothetical protein
LVRAAPVRVSALRVVPVAPMKRVLALRLPSLAQW